MFHSNLSSILHRYATMHTVTDDRRRQTDIIIMTIARLLLNSQLKTSVCLFRRDK